MITAKRKVLRLVCICILVLVLISHAVPYWRPETRNSQLLQLMETLHTSQIRNKALAIQILNRTGTDSENGAKERLRTRAWFDLRPSVNASKLSPISHPLFPGYVIENANVCGQENVDILIYFHSSLDHKETRRNIREGWANTQIFININVKLLFFLGVSNNQMAQRHIETEYSAYGDIVQADFLDSFPNLTYKAVTMLTWVNSHCKQVRYILKADDDMFVDIFRVVAELISKLASKPLALACDYKENMPIPRDPHAKWFVNQSLLVGQTSWPPFCSGYFVLMTGDLIPSLYTASFLVREYIPIDDAYLFGLLVQSKALAVEYVNIHEQISPNERPDPDKEIIINGKFQYLAFRVKREEDHSKLFQYRTIKLSKWEEAHSNYMETFDHNHKETAVIL